MNLFWIDLEMSGLNPQTEKILEFAGIVTDSSFANLASFHRVVYQPAEVLDNMGEWCKKHHGKSGLTAAVPNGVALGKVENEVLKFLKAYFPQGNVIIAGNSIHQDRKFIDAYMPKLNDFLHYRMLDVSSFKIIIQDLKGLKFHKNNSHRALDDIKESIDELKYYMKFFKTPEKN